MGYLTSILAVDKNPANDFWFNPIGGSSYQTMSGAYVSNDTGLQVSACFAAIRLIAETLAKVPCITYERLDENSKQRAINEQLYTKLHSRPNNYQTSFEWRHQAESHVLMRGYHFSQIIPDQDGPIGQLIPLNPDRMEVKRLPNYRRGYVYRDESGMPRPLTQDEVFQLNGPVLSCDDLVGVTPLTYARETIGAALTMAAYADALFRQGATHRGVYSVPGGLTTDQRKQMQAVIRAETAGVTGWHNTLILEHGAKWETTGMTAEDAQFLLSRKYNVIEIARWFNIQPHLLRDLEKSSYSNHEQESLEFAQVTMLPHYVNWEQSLSRDLVLEPERFFVEFLLDAIVRADIKTRYEAFGMGIDRGFLTPNEVRGRDNIGNPIPGGDNPRMQVNTVMIGPDGKPIPNPPGQNAGRRQSDSQQAREAYYNRVLCATADQVNAVEIKALKGIFSQHENEAKRKDEGLKFYDRFAAKVSKFLCVDHFKAQAFSTTQAKRFLNAVETGAQAELLADLEAKGQERLLAFAMRQGLAQETANELEAA